MNIISCRERLTLSSALRTIRNSGCAALVLLAATLLVVGCPDDADTGDANGTPTEATQVQNAASGASTIDAITLTWDAPTDIDGYMGVTITIKNNTDTLLDTVELDDSATEYQVTNLEAATEYTFTIATRYTASGKNNSTTIMATTVTATGVQNAAIATVGATTATLTWNAPTDTAGYEGVLISEASSSGNLITPQPVAAGTQSFAITELTADTSYRVTIQTQYTRSAKNNNTFIDIQTVTNTAVQHIAINGINTTALTLVWQNPEDTTDYTEVMITSEPAAGNIATPQTVPMATNTFAVTGLTAGTPYTYTFATIYSDDKTGSTTFTAETLTAASIDADADTLIDITSLERLHNIRYTLNGSSYKTSSTDPGSQCGPDGTDACTGYELTRSLDFTDAASYDGSIPNAMRMWRPNAASDSTGMVLAQNNADNATNGGWTPIGDNFASRFEGNGHTIRNLYSRNHTHVGLFSATTSAAVIRSIGMATAHIYGRANGSNGALVGIHNGIIVASYASGGTATGAAGTRDRVGGLVGDNEGTIVASYANGTFNTGNGTLPYTGGLVGRNNNNRIIASYANSNAKGGTGGTHSVGGLVGSNVNGHIIASYATGTVNGGGGSSDRIGGLVGNYTGSSSSLISASYADSNVDGGAGHNDTGGTLVGEYLNSPAITASYGFGTLSAELRDSNGEPPSGATTAAALIAPDPDDSTNTAVDAIWNDADSNTLNAWDFGNSSQAPALRYADYDGPTGSTYACGGTALTPAATIPDIVATPTGPMTITCGSTLLPDQEGR